MNCNKFDPDHEFCAFFDFVPIACAAPIDRTSCEEPKTFSRPLRTTVCCCCTGISYVETDPVDSPGHYGPYCGPGECRCEVRAERLRDVRCPPLGIRKTIIGFRPKVYPLSEPWAYDPERESDKP